MTKSVEDKKFVSVVVNFRNEARNLKQHIEALARQEYSKDKYEVIFIDDGSTDNSLQIARDELAEKSLPFAMVKHIDWTGTGGARKIAVEMSKGDIIAITDADAIQKPDWISQLADSLTIPKTGMVGGMIKEVPNLDDTDEQRECTTQEKTFWFVNIAFKREVFEKIGGFDRRFKRGSDYDIIARVLDAGFDYTYNPKAVVWHLKKPLSLSKSLRAELRNGEADTLFLLVDGRIFLRNFMKFPLSVKTRIANTVASLLSVPLLVAAFLLGGLIGLAVAAILVGSFVLARAYMSKTRKFRLLRALACIPIGILLWYHLLRSLPLAFHKRSEETLLTWASTK